MNFQPEKESWQSYAERLDHYFTANKVFEEDQKVSTLILENDPSVYTLLKQLSFPIDLKQLTYNDVMATLERHFVGVKNIFNERKVFYRAYMQPSETASEWHRRLKSLAINCEFGVFLDDILVDKFVCGFEGKVFQRLCEEGTDLNLLDAVEIAQLYEKLDAANIIIERRESLSSDDQDVDNIPIERRESLLSDNQESELEELDVHQDQDDQSSTLKQQEIDMMEGQDQSEQSQILQEHQQLQQQICFQQQLINQMLSQHQQPRPHHQIIVKNRHIRVTPQVQKPRQNQAVYQQKTPQKHVSHQKQQPTIKQQESGQKPNINKQKQQPSQQHVKNQHHQINYKPANPPHPHTKPQHQQPSGQKYNIHQKDQQHVNTQHKQLIQKAANLQTRQPNNQQQSVQKLTNQQKQQPQKPHTFQQQPKVHHNQQQKQAQQKQTSKNTSNCSACGKAGHQGNVCRAKPKCSVSVQVVFK